MCGGANMNRICAFGLPSFCLRLSRLKPRPSHMLRLQPCDHNAKSMTEGAEGNHNATHRTRNIVAMLLVVVLWISINPWDKGVVSVPRWLALPVQALVAEPAGYTAYFAVPPNINATIAVGTLANMYLSGSHPATWAMPSIPPAAVVDSGGGVVRQEELPLAPVTSVFMCAHLDQRAGWLEGARIAAFVQQHLPAEVFESAGGNAPSISAKRTRLLHLVESSAVWRKLHELGGGLPIPAAGSDEDELRRLSAWERFQGGFAFASDADGHGGGKGCSSSSSFALGCGKRTRQWLLEQGGGTRPLQPAAGHAIPESEKGGDMDRAASFRRNAANFMMERRAAANGASVTDEYYVKATDLVNDFLVPTSSDISRLPVPPSSLNAAGKSSSWYADALAEERLVDPDMDLVLSAIDVNVSDGSISLQLGDLSIQVSGSRGGKLSIHANGGGGSSATPTLADPETLSDTPLFFDAGGDSSRGPTTAPPSLPAPRRPPPRRLTATSPVTDEERQLSRSQWRGLRRNASFKFNFGAGRLLHVAAGIISTNALRGIAGFHLRFDCIPKQRVEPLATLKNAVVGHALPDEQANERADRWWWESPSVGTEGSNESATAGRPPSSVTRITGCRTVDDVPTSPASSVVVPAPFALLRSDLSGWGAINSVTRIPVRPSEHVGVDNLKSCRFHVRCPSPAMTIFVHSMNTTMPSAVPAFSMTYNASTYTDEEAASSIGAYDIQEEGWLLPPFHGGGKGSSIDVGSEGLNDSAVSHRSGAIMMSVVPPRLSGTDSFRHWITAEVARGGSDNNSASGTVKNGSAVDAPNGVRRGPSLSSSTWWASSTLLATGQRHVMPFPELRIVVDLTFGQGFSALLECVNLPGVNLSSTDAAGDGNAATSVPAAGDDDEESVVYFMPPRLATWFRPFLPSPLVLWSDSLLRRATTAAASSSPEGGFVGAISDGAPDVAGSDRSSSAFGTSVRRCLERPDDVIPQGALAGIYCRSASPFFSTAMNLSAEGSGSDTVAALGTAGVWLASTINGDAIGPHGARGFPYEIVGAPSLPSSQAAAIATVTPVACVVLPSADDAVFASVLNGMAGGINSLTGSSAEAANSPLTVCDGRQLATSMRVVLPFVRVNETTTSGAPPDSAGAATTAEPSTGWLAEDLRTWREASSAVFLSDGDGAGKALSPQTTSTSNTLGMLLHCTQRDDVYDDGADIREGGIGGVPPPVTSSPTASSQWATAALCDVRHVFVDSAALTAATSFQFLSIGPLHFMADAASQEWSYPAAAEAATVQRALSTALGNSTFGSPNNGGRVAATSSPTTTTRGDALRLRGAISFPTGRAAVAIEMGGLVGQVGGLGATVQLSCRQPEGRRGLLVGCPNPDSGTSFLGPATTTLFDNLTAIANRNGAGLVGKAALRRAAALIPEGMTLALRGTIKTDLDGARGDTLLKHRDLISNRQSDLPCRFQIRCPGAMHVVIDNLTVGVSQVATSAKDDSVTFNFTFPVGNRWRLLQRRGGGALSSLAASTLADHVISLSETPIATTRINSASAVQSDNVFLPFLPGTRLERIYAADVVPMMLPVSAVTVGRFVSATRVAGFQLDYHCVAPLLRSDLIHPNTHPPRPQVAPPLSSDVVTGRSSSTAVMFLRRPSIGPTAESGHPSSSSSTASSVALFRRLTVVGCEATTAYSTYLAKSAVDDERVATLLLQPGEVVELKTDPDGAGHAVQPQDRLRCRWRVQCQDVQRDPRRSVVPAAASAVGGAAFSRRWSPPTLSIVRYRTALNMKLTFQRMLLVDSVAALNDTRIAAVTNLFDSSGNVVNVSSILAKTSSTTAASPWPPRPLDTPWSTMEVVATGRGVLPSDGVEATIACWGRYQEEQVGEGGAASSSPSSVAEEAKVAPQWKASLVAPSQPEVYLPRRPLTNLMGAFGCPVPAATTTSDALPGQYVDQHLSVGWGGLVASGIGLLAPTSSDVVIVGSGSSTPSSAVPFVGETMPPVQATFAVSFPYKAANTVHEIASLGNSNICAWHLKCPSPHMEVRVHSLTINPGTAITLSSTNTAITPNAERIRISIPSAGTPPDGVVRPVSFAFGKPKDAGNYSNGASILLGDAATGSSTGVFFLSGSAPGRLPLRYDPFSTAYPRDVVPGLHWTLGAIGTPTPDVRVELSSVTGLTPQFALLYSCAPVPLLLSRRAPFVLLQPTLTDVRKAVAPAVERGFANGAPEYFVHGCSEKEAVDPMTAYVWTIPTGAVVTFNTDLDGAGPLPHAALGRECRWTVQCEEGGGVEPADAAVVDYVLLRWRVSMENRKKQSVSLSVDGSFNTGVNVSDVEVASDVPKAYPSNSQRLVIILRTDLAIDRGASFSWACRTRRVGTTVAGSSDEPSSPTPDAGLASCTPFRPRRNIAEGSTDRALLDDASATSSGSSVCSGLGAVTAFLNATFTTSPSQAGGRGGGGAAGSDRVPLCVVDDPLPTNLPGGYSHFNGTTGPPSTAATVEEDAAWKAFLPRARVCACLPGYAGPRCDRCAVGYSMDERSASWMNGPKHLGCIPDASFDVTNGREDLDDDQVNNEEGSAGVDSGRWANRSSSSDVVTEETLLVWWRQRRQAECRSDLYCSGNGGAVWNESASVASASSPCYCACHLGFGGERCDQCAEGFAEAPIACRFHLGVGEPSKRGVTPIITTAFTKPPSGSSPAAPRRSRSASMDNEGLLPSSLSSGGPPPSSSAVTKLQGSNSSATGGPGESPRTDHQTASLPGETVNSSIASTLLGNLTVAATSPQIGLLVTAPLQPPSSPPIVVTTRIAGAATMTLSPVVALLGRGAAPGGTSTSLARTSIIAGSYNCVFDVATDATPPLVELPLQLPVGGSVYRHRVGAVLLHTVAVIIVFACKVAYVRHGPSSASVGAAASRDGSAPLLLLATETAAPSPRVGAAGDITAAVVDYFHLPAAMQNRVNTLVGVESVLLGYFWPAITASATLIVAHPVDSTVGDRLMAVVCALVTTGLVLGDAWWIRMSMPRFFSAEAGSPAAKATTTTTPESVGTVDAAMFVSPLGLATATSEEGGAARAPPSIPLMVSRSDNVAAANGERTPRDDGERTPHDDARVFTMYDGCRDPVRHAARLYFIEDIVASALMGLLSGWKPDKPASCVNGVMMPIALLAVAHVGYVLYVRPLASRLETVGSSLLAGLQCVTAVVPLADRWRQPQVAEGGTSNLSPALVPWIDGLVAAQLLLTVVIPVLLLAQHIHQRFFADPHRIDECREEEPTSRDATTAAALAEVSSGHAVALSSLTALGVDRPSDGEPTGGGPPRLSMVGTLHVHGGASPGVKGVSDSPLGSKPDGGQDKKLRRNPLLQAAASLEL